jgi:CDP-glucose 4,6-dehydratase
MSSLFQQSFSGKKILITGHTGFKGSWLAFWLHHLGAKVVGYALPPNTKPSNFDALGLGKLIVNEFGDVRDARKIFSVVKKHKPEFVLHLAAQPLVRYSYKNPHETYETNIMGLVNVFEAIRKVSSVKFVLNVTSDKCYENVERIWGYRENEPMGGYDPYSSSKGCAELITSAYRRSFFQNASSPVLLASGRAGNVIGGGDWALDRIIPDSVRAIARGQVLEIRNPGAIRPWQHVLEPLSGYLNTVSKMMSDGAAFAEGWNFGPKANEILTVEEIVKCFIANWKGNYKVTKSSQTQHEAHFLQLDCSKAFAQLGWQAALHVTEAVEMTVAWYKAYYSAKSKNMQEFTLSQIRSYTEKANSQNISWASE